MSASTDRAASGFGTHRPMHPPTSMRVDACPSVASQPAAQPPASEPSSLSPASSSYEQRVRTCVRWYEQDMLALEDRASALRAWTSRLENLADDVVRSDMLLRDADAEAFGFAAPIVSLLHNRGDDAVGAAVHAFLDARDEVECSWVRTKREIEDLHDRHRRDLAALEAERERERGCVQGRAGECEQPCDKGRGLAYDSAHGSEHGPARGPSRNSMQGSSRSPARGPGSSLGHDPAHGPGSSPECDPSRSPAYRKERERHENRG